MFCNCSLKDCIQVVNEIDSLLPPLSLSLSLSLSTHRGYFFPQLVAVEIPLEVYFFSPQLAALIADVYAATIPFYPLQTVVKNILQRSVAPKENIDCM